MILDDPILMMRWTVGFASISSLVMSAELVAVAAWRQRGVFWRCCQASLTEGSTLPLPQRILRPVARAIPGLLWLYALSAAATLFLASTGGSYGVALLVLTVVSLVVSSWRLVGGDGASQMTLIVLTACSLGLFAGPTGARLVMWFIGLQGLLAYFSAGVAKVVSSEWRNEDIVSRIASTVSHGNDIAARLLDAAPGLGRALTISVIAFELSMPAAVFVPVQVTMAFLLMAAFFHLGCAIVMGLNDFVWAFASTYPAILFISAALQHFAN
jgi:hypothetical protein